MAVGLIKLSKQLGLAVHIEVHRDTATETPEKFTEIARLYKKATGEVMPVTWDHSHFAVSKHVMPADYSSRLLAWPAEIQHSQMFHLRPFNSQHCQVPVTNGRGKLTPEFVDYIRFVEDLFALWLKGPRPGGELWVCPEMGMSHGYNLSGDPPVWLDVIRCRKEILGAQHRIGAREPCPQRTVHAGERLVHAREEIAQFRAAVVDAALCRVGQQEFVSALYRFDALAQQQRFTHRVPPWPRRARRA